MDKEQIQKQLNNVNYDIDRLGSEISSLNRQANNLNGEIETLNELKAKYEIMNGKLKNAINFLFAAKQYLDTAKTEFDKNYSSDTAKNKSKEFKREADEINQLYSELNNTILPASQRKAMQIKNNMDAKEKQVRSISTQISQKTSLRNTKKEQTYDLIKNLNSK